MGKKKMFTIQEVADKLGFTYITVYFWIRKGILPYFNYNGSYRIAEKDLKAFIEAGYQKKSKRIKK